LGLNRDESSPARWRIEAVSIALWGSARISDPATAVLGTLCTQFWA